GIELTSPKARAKGLSPAVEDEMGTGRYHWVGATLFLCAGCALSEHERPESEVGQFDASDGQNASDASIATSEHLTREAADETGEGVTTSADQNTALSRITGPETSSPGLPVRSDAGSVDPSSTLDERSNQTTDNGTSAGTTYPINGDDTWSTSEPETN